MAEEVTFGSNRSAYRPPELPDWDGRLEQELARQFLDFIGGIKEGDRVLDVGCGTGSLTFSIAATNKASEIIGIDPSMGYLEYARTHNPYFDVRFESGTAEKLPYSDGSFDCCLASLIVQFVPDAYAAAREMKRVTKPGGIVATCMWDNSGGLELAERFWDAAVAVDPEAKKPSANRYGSSAALSDLWATADLTAITTDALVVPIQFSSFEHLWEVQTKTQGPAKPYITNLTEGKRHVLKERLRHELLKDGAGRIYYTPCEGLGSSRDSAKIVGHINALIGLKMVITKVLSIVSLIAVLYGCPSVISNSEGFYKDRPCRPINWREYLTD